MRLRLRSSIVPVTAVVALLGLAGCSTPGASGTPGAGSTSGNTTATTTTPPEPTITPVTWVTTPTDKDTNVPVDTRVRVSAQDGDLEKVELSYLSKKGNTVQVDGWLESGQWTADDLLEPGVKYTLKMTARDDAQQVVTKKRTFTSADLTLDDQIYTKIIPSDGATVGVGMPIIATFDLPVKDKANFEKHMNVQTTPEQVGSWYWLNDREAHWRPKNYWIPGTKVHVEAKLNGVPAGGNRYGEQSRVQDFTIGRSVVAKANLKTHMMDVYISGKKARTIPFSGGRPGWDTRSGVKVIMEKFDNFTMVAESIGLKEGDKDYYHDVTVKHALRLTHSGEFLHSAPWSVAAQGHDNVSHGCTGISDPQSDWVNDNMRVGDVVETTGSTKPMTLGNGYADWNLSWANWQKGSAL